MDRSKELAALLDLARELGAVSAEVLVEEKQGSRLAFERGKVVRQPVVTTASLTARAWAASGLAGEVRGKVQLGPDLIREALRRASASGVPLAPPVTRAEANSSVVDGDDRRYPTIRHEDRVEVLTLAEKGVQSVDPDLEALDFQYEDARVVRTFLNSRGVRGREAGTWFRLSGAARSPGLGITLAENVADRAFSTVVSLPIGINLARRLVDLQGARAHVEGPIRVALPPRVVADLFTLLGPSFCFEPSMDPATFIGRSRRERPWANLLHLVDDGLAPGALRTSAFDDRGVGPLPVTLIRDGKIEGSFLDLARARALGARPTGHEQVGGLAPRNLILRGGSRSINAILAEERVPVLVLDHVRGLTEGLDLRTGSLRCGASGRLVGPKNHAVGFLPFLELQADLDTVFRNVLDLASDTDRFGFVDAPGMLVDGFTARTVDGPADLR